MQENARAKAVPRGETGLSRRWEESLRAEGNKRAQTGQKVRLQEGVQESAKGNLLYSRIQISRALLHYIHLQELLLQARLQVHGRPQGVLLQSPEEDQKDQVRQIRIVPIKALFHTRDLHYAKTLHNNKDHNNSKALRSRPQLQIILFWWVSSSTSARTTPLP